MPRPLLLVYVTAAVLTPLGAWTGNWPLALTSGLVGIAAWLTLGRRYRRASDGPQAPLDDAYHAQPLRRRVWLRLTSGR